MQVETTFTGFANREEGGRLLAKELQSYRGRPDAIVLGLPRGGVITAAAVAEELDLPLDVIVVRKLGVPGHEELAMGAVGPGGTRVLNKEVLAIYRVDPEDLRAEIAREHLEVERRERVFRPGMLPLDLKEKVVIVVDDGVATGATMQAAIDVIRSGKPARIVLAVPVAPIETIEQFRLDVDEIVYLETPDPFGAVGYWYVDFAEVTDDEVVRTLDHARNPVAV